MSSSAGSEANETARFAPLARPLPTFPTGARGAGGDRGVIIW